MIEVVFLDERNFIREYRHFDIRYNPGYELWDYIKYGISDEDVAKIEIKRPKGETNERTS